MAHIGVTIDGNNYSAYAENLVRENHLCMPGGMFQLRLAANAPAASLQPWRPVSLTEQGTLVLTGYVERVEFNRPPTHIMVLGKDTWKRASDWFIWDNLFSAGEQVDYWVDYLCNLVGLSYTLVAKYGRRNAVKDGLQLGLKHVSEALLAVCAYAKWCIRVNPSGVAEFRSVDIPKTSQFSIVQKESEEVEQSDLNTRTTAKIWGLGNMTYQETRSVPGISPERIMLFSDPNLDTVSKMKELARAALDQFADVTREAHLQIVPIPSLQVGDFVRYYSSGSSASYYQTVTDLRSTMKSDAYDQTVALGRRCFRLPAFPVLGGSTGCLCGGNLQTLNEFSTSATVSGICEAPGITLGIVNPDATINGKWRVERWTLLGGLLWTVTVNVPSSGQMWGGGVCVSDETYLYTGGQLVDLFQSGPRMEKRRLTDGGAEWTIQFGTVPGVAHTVDDIDVDATGVYFAYTLFSGGVDTYFVEKRQLSNGAVIWTQSLDYQARGISVDNTGIYISGTRNGFAYIEKRTLTNTAIWSQTSTAINGWGCYPGYDGVYMAIRYTSGASGGGVEKRDKASGALIWQVYRDTASFTRFVRTLGQCVYAIGNNYFERRNICDGFKQEELDASLVSTKKFALWPWQAAGTGTTGKVQLVGL